MVALPDYAVRMLHRRAGELPATGPESTVFPGTLARTLRDPTKAGFTPRKVADQLGHADPSMTLDAYFGRRVVSAAAAQVLDRPT